MVKVCSNKKTDTQNPKGEVGLAGSFWGLETEK
jgi:hypothetical protein